MSSTKPSTDHPPLRRELRAVANLAAPVVMVQLGMMLMSTVDTMMLGRVSATALASGALGAGVSFGLVTLPMGILMALDPLVSQAWGVGDSRGVATHFKRGLVSASVLSILVALCMIDLRPVLRLLGQQPEVIDPAGQYLRALIPGIPAFLLFVVVRQTLQAMSVVRSAVLAIVISNLLNVVANYSLIFGHFGLPRLEVLGSGLATSLSRWSMLLLLVAFEWRRFAALWPARKLADLRLRGYRQMLSLGVPIGIQISFEMWLFVAVALMMGQLGARELAAHQIALNLSALSFMVPLGIAGAAATRVGNAIGRRDMPGARRAAQVCLAIGGSVMTVSALAFALAPRALARLYTDTTEVVALAAVLLPVAALFQVFDGLQVVGAGVLRGAGDTRVPAIIALIGYWVLGLPLAYFVAFRLQRGPEGLWWGLTAGLMSVAVLFLIRIARTFGRDIAAIVVVED
jgi:MATE family multidrug resistance protein